jgi:hypothetical protein
VSGSTPAASTKFPDEVGLDALIAFRDTWTNGPLRKKQERVIGFFWGLQKIKVNQTPTD